MIGRLLFVMCNYRPAQLIMYIFVNVSNYIKYIYWSYYGEACLRGCMGRNMQAMKAGDAKGC